MAALTAVGGAAAFVLRWFSDRRKSALDEAQAMLAEMHKLQAAITEEHSTCREALREAERRIEQLTARVEALEADASPFFSWVESEQGKVMSMSSAFRRGVLAPSGLSDAQVLGHRLVDLEAFRPAAAILTYMDRVAILSGYAGASDVMLSSRRWCVIKALVIAPDGSRQIHCAAAPI